MAEPIADLGFGDDIPVSSEAPPDLGKLAFTPETWFLLSRVDGKVSLKDLLRISGLPHQQTIDTLRTLSDHRLITLPNRSSPLPEPKKEPIEELRPTNWPVSFDQFTFDPLTIEQEGAMPLPMRKLLAYYHYHLRRVSFYDLFGVERNADLRQIQDAYYRLAKVFHPDRWFRKEIGPLEQPLKEVFRWVNKAYQTLGSPRNRQEYDRYLDQGYVGPWERQEKKLRQKRSKSLARQGPTEISRLTFDSLVVRARRLRSLGQLTEAADWYRRALRLTEERQVAMELAETVLESGDGLEEALELVRTLSTGGQPDPTLLLLEAKLLARMNRPDEARARLQTILAVDPGHHETLVELAKLPR
ncbi:MAG: DnaJ domain-containing protein [Bradymonadales bacterium]|nr:DnaJ domain-containing protein [Bradymonadales bacterium]